MEKNLIKNLGFVQIIKINFDILLKKMNILIKVNKKNIIKIYELNALEIKELYFNSQNFKSLKLAELDFINVKQNNGFYYINLQLVNSDINIKIICREFEWNFLGERDFIVDLGTF